MTTKKKKTSKNYGHYNDYAFKSVLRKRANGLLKFIGIPYEIKDIFLSELTDIGPKIHRMDFAGSTIKNDEEISLILEFQTYPPNDDDIERFFQYISTLRVFKKKKVELYILCLQKVPYTKKEYVINDDCIYTMHVISLKDIRAEDIFNKVENKLKNNDEITDDDIAALQLIIYTDYSQTKLEIVNKARELINKIAETSGIDINEKIAILYILDLLSTNMLNTDELNRYMEEHKMIINPRERYFNKKGREEGKMQVAKDMIEIGYTLDEISRATKIPKNKLIETIKI